LILTHAADDGALFVDQSIITDEALTKFIKAAFTYDDVAASVLARYPAAKYPSVIARQSAIINDAVFTCNYRWVANAYPGMTYNAQIAFGTGLHGAILPGAFFNPTLSINASGTSFPVPAVWGRESLYRGFQSYVVNHAISGNPNSARVPLNGIKWPQASTTQSERLSNVLNVTNDGYQLITDGLGLKSTCEFWLSVHSKLTQRAHY
jgi:carboxylesterase type B